MTTTLGYFYLRDGSCRELVTWVKGRKAEPDIPETMTGRPARHTVPENITQPNRSHLLVSHNGAIHTEKALVTNTGVEMEYNGNLKCFVLIAVGQKPKHTYKAELLRIYNISNDNEPSSYSYTQPF